MRLRREGTVSFDEVAATEDMASVDNHDAESLISIYEKCLRLADEERNATQRCENSDAAQGPEVHVKRIN
jgi:hypothetical protein